MPRPVDHRGNAMAALLEMIKNEAAGLFDDLTSQIDATIDGAKVTALDHINRLQDFGEALRLTANPGRR